jgi:dihydrodipicolinate synthase/N-acetylneuraminate lyase
MGRSLPANILCPMVTAFKENGDLDPEAIARQTLRLARAGVGIALMGTNGEMGHLSAEERANVVRTARSALDENGFKETALVAGCGDNSTRLTIQRCKEAAAAGADYALVIFPGYFAFAVGKPAIKQCKPLLASVAD